MEDPAAILVEGGECPRRGAQRETVADGKAHAELIDGLGGLLRRVRRRRHDLDPFRFEGRPRLVEGRQLANTIGSPVRAIDEQHPVASSPVLRQDEATVGDGVHLEAGKRIPAVEEGAGVTRHGARA